MSETFSDQDTEDGQPAEPAANRPHAPEIKQPGAGRRLSYSLFSRETRTGRFLRALVRWLLTIIFLVGAGMLIMYLVFYRPVDQQLRDTRASLANSEQVLLTAQEERDLAVEQREVAAAREQEAQERLTTELTRVRLLRGMNNLKNAQLAAQGKNDTGAKNALTTAEGNLKQLYSRLDRLDPTNSSSIEARLTLVRNALNRDAETAIKEIEALVSELSRMENELK